MTISGCARTEDAAAYALGEMSSDATAAFERHLATCPACRAIAADIRFVVAELRKRPEQTVSHDLTADILERIPEDAWTDKDDAAPQFAPWAPLAPFASARRAYHGLKGACFTRPRDTRGLALRAAAGLLVALGGAWLAWHWLGREPGPAARPPVVRTTQPKEESAPTRADAIGGALDWLVAAQDYSGAWDPVRWGGKKEYEISLTGMALLALMNDRTGLRRPAREQSVERALEHLFKQQKENGALGAECAGIMYNHSLATLALLEAYRLKDGPRLKGAVDSAVRFIGDRQNDNGGWGYQKGPGRQANTSVTVWQIKTLLSARQAGWNDAEAALRKGLAWLHGVVDEQGLFGYQRPKDSPEGGSDTLTAMGALCFFLAESQGAEPGASDDRIRVALKSAASHPGKQPDFYRWYFVASALSAGKEEGYDRLLADLQSVLLRERSRDSAQAGSWDPVGRWSSAGGRLYTTAMAALSLQAQTPDGQPL
ncbi:MAG: zf-HC2 domain-containing protein [Verrucomicrobiota bacterium]|nr:zf-HC2 domain-containing protein [Verrucomicrobiota bacterium]